MLKTMQNALRKVVFRMWLHAIFALVGIGMGALGYAAKRWAVPRILSGGSPFASLIAGIMPFIYLPPLALVAILFTDYFIALACGLAAWTIGVTVYLATTKLKKMS